MRPSKLRTGVFFIGLGVALLLYNMDKLHGDYFIDLLHLWPVLLIAIGIEIIARHSSVPALGYLSPLLIAGAYFYAGYADPAGWGRDGWIFIGDDYDRTTTVERSFTAEGDVNEARVYVDLYDGDLNIGAGASDLGDGKFTCAGRILSSLSIDDNRAVMRIRQSGRARRSKADLKLKLTDAIPIVLDLKGENADVDLEAKELRVQRLYLDLADGQANMTFGRLEDSVWASMSPGDSRIRLWIPDGAGLRVEGDDVDSKIDWGGIAYLTVDDGIETEGFAAAVPKITLRLEKPARSLKVEAY